MDKLSETIWEAGTWLIIIILALITVSAFPWYIAESILRYLFFAFLIAAIFWYLRSKKLYYELYSNFFEFKKKQEEVENNQRIMKMVFEHSKDGILVLDQKGRIVSFSPGLELLTGFKKDEVLGLLAKNVLDFKGDEENPILPDAIFLPEIFKKFPYVVNTLTTKNNKAIQIESSYALINSSTGQKGLAIIRDLSNRKKTDY